MKRQWIFLAALNVPIEECWDLLEETISWDQVQDIDLYINYYGNQLDFVTGANTEAIMP